MMIVFCPHNNKLLFFKKRYVIFIRLRKTVHDQVPIIRKNIYPHLPRQGLL